MSKHTPGPWTAIADSGDENADDGWYVLNDQETAIAVGLYEPDARLIAAAPDLLDACRQARIVLFHNKDMRDTLTAAILKAEGE